MKPNTIKGEIVFEGVLMTTKTNKKKKAIFPFTSYWEGSSKNTGCKSFFKFHYNNY